MILDRWHALCYATGQIFPNIKHYLENDSVFKGAKQIWDPCH
jgi:hypothetical protein